MEVVIQKRVNWIDRHSCSGKVRAAGRREFQQTARMDATGFAQSNAALVGKAGANGFS